jgi:hypothetical protein
MEEPRPGGDGAGPREEPPPRRGQAAAGLTYRLAWSVYLVLALVAVLWIGLRDGGISLALFFGARPHVDLGLGLAAAASLRLLWAGAERLLPSARRLNSELAALLGPLSASELLALALLSGFAEELFFRGALQGSVGWLVATVLFALLHTGPGRTFRLWGLFALIAGGLFGALVLWRGNLLASIVGHVLVNAVGLRQLAHEQADRRDSQR